MLTAVHGLVFALSFLPARPAVQPESERGIFLVRQCRATTLTRPTLVEIDDGNMCMAYLEGFVDGRPVEYKYGCMIGHSYSELVAAYLAYMQKNPESLQMSKRWGIDATLMLFCMAHKGK